MASHLSVGLWDYKDDDFSETALAQQSWEKHFDWNTAS